MRAAATGADAQAETRGCNATQLDQHGRARIGLRHMSVQWAHLGTGGVLVASSRGASIHRPQLGALGHVGPMGEFVRGSVATTRHLLDGAIAAAERDSRARQESPSPERWAWQLANQWYCAHHSLELMPEAIARYEAIDRDDLAEFARGKLAEERGHDRFPLNDLTALGYDADALVREVPPAPEVLKALEFARRSVRGRHPVRFIGYMYTLERRILKISERSLAAIEAMLPTGVHATSFVRAHTGGMDAEHVQEAVRFIARLPADDRATIAIACHRVTQICCTRSRQHPSDAELWDRLVGYRPTSARSHAERRSTKGPHT